MKYYSQQDRCIGEVFFHRVFGKVWFGGSQQTSNLNSINNLKVLTNSLAPMYFDECPDINTVLNSAMYSLKGKRIPYQYQSLWESRWIPTTNSSTIQELFNDASLVQPTIFPDNTSQVWHLL